MCSVEGYRVKVRVWLMNLIARVGGYCKMVLTSLHSTVNTIFYLFGAKGFSSLSL